MELVRIIILSAAFLVIIGVGGLIYNAEFTQASANAIISNFGLVLIAILFLIFATYLLLKQEVRMQIRKIFLERSDEATLLFVKNRLKGLKEYLNEIKKIDKRNANKVLKELKVKLEELNPYKAYLSSIFVEGEFLENMNKILSYNKITSKNLSEFSVAINELKKELQEI